MSGTASSINRTARMPPLLPQVLDVHTNRVEARVCRCAEGPEDDQWPGMPQAKWSGIKKFDCADGVCRDLSHDDAYCGCVPPQ